MTKFYVFIFILALLILSVISLIINTYNYAYSKGYAAGADTISENHVNEICMQWLFQSDLEKARRKVCGK
jgi:ABC-type cobalt transport system substrate-binding protein